MTTALIGTIRFGLLALGAWLAVMGLSAASAPAAVEWRVTSVHGPQNIPPGDGNLATIEGQYVIHVYNIGDQDAVDPYTITDTLPPGVTAVAASGTGSSTATSGGGWDCSATAFPATTVSCTGTDVVEAPLTDVDGRGIAPPLLIAVATSGSGGTHPNEVTISGGGADASTTDATTFSAVPAGFGFVADSFQADAFDARFPLGGPVRQAGSHPFELRVDFDMNLALGQDPDDQSVGDLFYTHPDRHVKTLQTRLPVGLLGNPQATPKCSADLLNSVGPGGAGKGACPANTQVGVMDLVVNDGKQLQNADLVTDVPLYNMEPPPGRVAAFGFSILGNPTWMIAELDPADRHSVVVSIPDTIELLPLRSARATFWGVPADPAHDALRLNPDADGTTAMGTPSTAPIKPFLTLPGQCDTGGSIRQRSDSWQSPGAFTSWESGAEIQASGCEDPRVRFEPRISIEPTSRAAASPTGLDIQLTVPQKDDSFPNGDAAINAANAQKLYAQSGNDRAIVTPNVRDVVTKLPSGMAVNPSVADGLVGCSLSQIGLEGNGDPSCPDNSKIGTVEIDSPLMAKTMHGSIYQAKQSENPFGSLLSFYTVAKGPGLIIKLAARVDADPQTGQLTTTFLDNPQLAFERYRLRFFGGSRAPLVTPPTCGTYSGSATVSAWNSSVEPRQIGDSFQITSGPNGKPCPGSLADRLFDPGFDAKTLLPIAGAHSPFALEASREDGTQELATIETTLPPGMLGRLAGIPYCPESAIASISTAPGTGLGERLSPSCPAASLVGHTDAAAGAGALPFHNPGNVYLTGPRGQAPLSLAIVTPVVAGPLDLGSIVVRASLSVDPKTARIRVLSDPLPERIVADGNGFPLNLRSVRATMDRPGFTLNPTSCDPMAVDGLIGSLQGALAPVSERFQVGACAALGFKPKLSLRLKGATKRGKNPRLIANLKARGGEANIARAQVTLPRSAFLDQSHIKTVCTRVQFAADRCPRGSVYGKATAKSPLLDYPLTGKVYLRSSNNKLPDLVADLRGPEHQPIRIELVGRTDAVKGALRNTFDAVPDAPVSSFRLELFGGKRGLVVNSRSLCAARYRATVKMDGQNGKAHDTRPVLQSDCGRRAGGR